MTRTTAPVRHAPALSPARTVRIAAARSPGGTRTHLCFYGRTVDIAVDADGRFVSCAVSGELVPDRPLFVPHVHEATRRRRVDRHVPIDLLADDRERIVGIQVLDRGMQDFVGTGWRRA